MSAAKLTAAVPLTRATSRTFTARGPLPNVVVAQVEGTANLGSIYAGPVVREARSPFVDDRVNYPISFEALQVHALATDNNAVAAMTLVLDLGEQREVSRIELYGNLLLPPANANGQPVHNFGLPRGVGVAVAEEFIGDVDLHNRFSYLVWQSDSGQMWHPRFQTHDFRALWGWTPIHLPPTFGRYLMFYFWDLPLIYPDTGEQPTRGIDLQRLVLYPCLQDVDHRPQIEFAPIAAWQTRFQSSRFWSSAGVATARPASHQSVYRTDDGHVLLPSALTGIGLQSASASAPPVFSSDVVTPGSTDRISLVLQATTDETPLINGVALLFEPPAAFNQQGTLPNYRISVYTTNDPEAAWSDAAHPSWRLAVADRTVYASAATTTMSKHLIFDDVRWARYVKLTVQVSSTPGLAAADARFVLAGLSLLRPRDFVLTPEEDQDVRTEYVVLRLRGPELLADYARFDGVNGASLTVEVQTAGGPFTTLYAFRTLLDLLENAQTRTFFNQRYVDKPVQVIRERIDSNFGSMQTVSGETMGGSTATVKPEFHNRQVVESGTVVLHTAKPQDGATTSAAFSSLPTGPEADGSMGWVSTQRKYGLGGPPPQMNFVPLPAPDTNPATFQAGMSALLTNVETLRSGIDSSGLPGSVSLGVAAGWSGGAGGWCNFNVGGSLSASLQLGGGLTRNLMTGQQGSVSTTESRTTEMSNKQDIQSWQNSFNQQGGISADDRVTRRVDESEEKRRPGVAVQYGNKVEDIVLAAIPVNVFLRGPAKAGVQVGQAVVATPPTPQPPTPGDVLRVRVDHLPPGVSLDVEFRGSILPQERTSS